MNIEHQDHFKRRISPRLAGSLIGVTVLCIGCIIAFMRYQILIQNEARNSQEVLELIEQNIEQTIQDLYSVALTIALTVNENGVVKNFQKVAKSLLDNYETVDVLQLVPDGIIQYVYPLEGNESVIGYDILSDPNVNEAVKRAAESGSIYFAGPIDLKQGGRAVIGRLPVFINDELWGFSAVVIYLETLIEKSGINGFPQDRYYFQLAKIDLNTGEEEYFLPVREKIKLSDFEFINFPEGDWKLYVTKIGTSQPLVDLWLIIGLSVIGALIGGFLVSKIMQKPFELEELLSKQTKQIKKNSDLLSSVLESQRAMVIFSLDRNYNYLAFNKSYKEHAELMFNVKIEVGDHVFDFIPSDEKEKFKKNYDRALRGKHFDYTHEYVNQKGMLTFWENQYAPIVDNNGAVSGFTVFSYNTTQRVKAENEISVEKQLSDTIINSLPGVFYLYNKEGKFYRWNKNFEKVTGYSAKKMESAHPLNFFADDEKELLAEKIAKVFENGEDNVEANFISRDGSKIPYYFTGASINYRGEKCLLGIGLDISEQKKVEQKHQKVLQQLQSHLNNSPLGVVEFDNELKVINWSKRCEEIFGWNEQEMLHKNAFEIIYEQDKTKTEVVAQELSTGSVDSNISNNRNHTKSGDIIDCIWYNSVIKDSSGEVVTVMSLVEDVTEKKKVEEQIAQSEKRYRTLVKNSPFCIHELDLHQCITSMNKAGLDMMCISKEADIVGTEYGDFVKEEDKNRIKKLFSNALSGESSEFEFSSNDDRSFYSSFVPIMNDENEVQRVMGITQDITARKKSEELIANSLKEKTTLLSEIHHRVKNNLAIVSGLLELQKFEMQDEKVIAAFEKSISRIISIAMVHELMYKSPNLSSVDVNSYLERLIPAIGATMQDESKNVNFVIDIEEYKLNINEAIPLGLLFNELITNSFKYAFKDQEKRIIHIDLSAQKNKISVLYEDNGVGYDPSINFDEPKNLGLNLIHAQLQQLDATYEVDTKSRFRLEFSFSPKPTTSKKIG